MSQHVIILAPHPDDEAIGCGGAICQHRANGDDVTVIYLTSGDRGIPGLDGQAAADVRESEARRSAEILNVNRLEFFRFPDQGLAAHDEEAAASLADYLMAHRSHLMYLPHPAESHPDHAAMLPIACRALDLMQATARPELRGYEVWTPMSSYGWPLDITPFMARKLRAIRCFDSQLVLFRYDRAVRGLNQYRGELAARCRYAEVFVYLDPTAEKIA